MASRWLVASFVLAVAACGPKGGGADDDDDDDDDGIDAPVAIDAGTDGVPGIDAPEPPKNAAVFAHTATTLYRVDPDTLALTMVGPFGGDAAGDSMTDIAIDGAGDMIGISYSRVYRVDSATAVGTRIGTGTLPQTFNGLSFVTSQLAFGTPGPEILVGTRNTDGKVFQIDPLTGVATEIGDMGGGYASSGDIVAVTGFGIVATVTGGTGLGDTLVRLAPSTFTATPIGTGTGFSGLWGAGYWRDRVFGFSSNGDFVGIDTTTGAGTLISSAGQGWWGAAVTTAAPIIP